MSVENDIDNELEALMKAAEDERDAQEELNIEPEINEEVIIESKSEEENSELEVNSDEKVESISGEEAIEVSNQEPVEEKDIKEAIPFTPVTITANGKDYEIDNIEDLVKLAGRGANIKAPKTETLVDERNIISQAGLSKEDLTLLVDAKNGDANAISRLANMGKIDIMELTEDMGNNYQSQFQATPESDVDKASGVILDNGHGDSFQEAINTTPQDFRDALAGNAQYITAFNEHVQAGISGDAIATAERATVMNGGNFLDHYISAVNRIISSPQSEAKSTVQKKDKRTVSEKEKLLRQKAGDGGTSHHTAPPVDGSDIWDMSDKDFDEMVAKSAR